MNSFVFSLLALDLPEICFYRVVSLAVLCFCSRKSQNTVYDKLGDFAEVL